MCHQDKIAGYLSAINRNFLNREEQWCDLRFFQFSNGQHRRYADEQAYSNRLMEEYYLLKFYPLYLEEYYLMYRNFLASHKSAKLRILSLGVGSGIDYTAMQRAHSEAGRGDRVDSYIGVDRVRWHYLQCGLKFVKEDIGCLDASYFKEIDLVVFPKSIMELDREHVEHVARSIITHQPEQFSIASSFAGGASGHWQMRLLDELLKDGGYQGDVCPDQCCEVLDANTKIEYPISFKSWLDRLRNHCGGCAEDAECCITQHPMLSKRYMAFNVIKYTKG